MKLGPINIEMEGGPGWKTSTVGVLKLFNAGAASLLAFYRVDASQGATVLENLPWPLIACVLLHVILSAVGNLLAQDKTYDGQQTASRAVIDGGVPVPKSPAYSRDAQDVADRIAMQRQIDADTEAGRG